MYFFSKNPNHFPAAGGSAPRPGYVKRGQFLVIGQASPYQNPGDSPAMFFRSLVLFLE